MRVTFRRVAATLILLGAGCDPILNVEGSFFPAWMVAMAIGIALTVVVRYVFVITRLEPHLGPPLLIYTSLGLLLTLVTWLVLYRT
jgi:YtcA family